MSGLADDPVTGVRRGRFSITGNELRQLFSPVMEAIVTLVKEQIKALDSIVPKAVLLVGGFGQSAYVRETLRAALAESSIEVFQPANG